AVQLGHSISETAPSLFTFCVRDSLLQDLSGLSMPECEMVLRMADGTEFRQRGAVLVTHWGLSGPAVLKLSAWAARELKRANYRAELQINWVADLNAESCASRLRQYREEHPARTIASNPQFGFPRRLWEHLVDRAEIAQETPFSSLSNERLLALARAVTQTKVRVDGKGVFKEEFVTCGGVTLSEVDFKTMESKIVPDLYLAGEVLDIDGVTGGFNFQAAWTTGWIAGSSMR
ncbi:MAG: aminoacetone oxidase family FAD-binding enzyme, partial [Deltaproteobacteria bacterium]|nr:aminoacetone oxidase family FAD-binding enzyme [Deltaproteobacteria bacterium]